MLGHVYAHTHTHTRPRFPDKEREMKKKINAKNVYFVQIMHLFNRNRLLSMFHHNFQWFTIGMNWTIWKNAQDIVWSIVWHEHFIEMNQIVDSINEINVFCSIGSVGFSFACICFAWKIVYYPAFACRTKCITLKLCIVKLLSRQRQLSGKSRNTVHWTTLYSRLNTWRCEDGMENVIRENKLSAKSTRCRSKKRREDEN